MVPLTIHKTKRATIQVTGAGRAPSADLAGNPGRTGVQGPVHSKAEEASPAQPGRTWRSGSSAVPYKRSSSAEPFPILFLRGSAASAAWRVTRNSPRPGVTP